jgi:hypothetical protein
MDRRSFLKMSLGAGAVAAAASGLAVSGTLERARWGLSRYMPSLLHSCVHVKNHSEHGQKMLGALIEGMEKKGATLQRGEFRQVSPDADIDIISFWWEENVIRNAIAKQRPLLVIEQGFFAKRWQWITMAWNGFNNLGSFAPAPETEKKEKWDQHFFHLLKPWKKNPKGHVLLFGQQPDLYLAMRGIENDAWVSRIAAQLRARGYSVMYRPHPRIREGYELQGRQVYVPDGVRLSPLSMAESLEGAAFCVSLCTNAAVESVLEGYPTIALDKASLAYDITSHSLDDPFYYPDRLPWCYELAGRHWSYDEVRSGKAWERSLPLIYA